MSDTPKKPPYLHADAWNDFMRAVDSSFLSASFCPACYTHQAPSRDGQDWLGDGSSILCDDYSCSRCKHRWTIYLRPFALHVWENEDEPENPDNTMQWNTDAVPSNIFESPKTNAAIAKAEPAASNEPAESLAESQAEQVESDEGA